MSTATRVDLLELADVGSAAIVEHLTFTCSDTDGLPWKEATARIDTAIQAAHVVTNIRYCGGTQPLPDDLAAVREVLVDYLEWAVSLASEHKIEGNPEATVAFWQVEEARAAAVIDAMGWGERDEQEG